MIVPCRWCHVDRKNCSERKRGVGRDQNFISVMWEHTPKATRGFFKKLGRTFCRQMWTFDLCITIYSQSSRHSGLCAFPDSFQGNKEILCAFPVEGISRPALSNEEVTRHLWLFCISNVAEPYYRGHISKTSKKFVIFVTLDIRILFCVNVYY